jgi:hypothetical protein
VRILINDKEVLFPSSLSEITLGQRIAFQEEHGNLLDQMLESILAMDDELLKELEMIEFRMEKMFRTFAFFAGCTVEAVKEYKSVNDVVNIYYSCLAVLFEDEEKQELQRAFIWKEEEWEMADPELKHGDQGKFGEFIDAKQTVKDLIDLGRGRWTAMLRLSAIYLRKKGEPYKEEFLYDGSDRLELMKSLPMDIALQVGFFLSGTMNFYLNTLMSSEKAGSKGRASISKHTSTAMAG